MNVFLDASALAKRYVQEPGSARVDELLGGASALGLSVLALPEVISALCRRRRERVLDTVRYRVAKTALLADVADAELVVLTDAVIAAAVRLLEAPLLSLRAADAIHVASAETWGADLFVSADTRQCAAARTAGLAVEEVRLD